ncbi:hypothetical protein [Pseudorhodoplanes sinuspersici]|uniref:Uncharacterized protein n=1 Tax=Pseudorhodoplanes sinuspersici TaxID=1235591 RepID=A0A1W6ZKK6_9HYPH|nr:hypothetical protein [Pseudorhodoplanes sinuspersici]ARP97879.1 hypothetical protein CAK95_01370 [Pseudorhodoplanes sinuspersici]RKE68383.1 hypothetical protein DFP91_4769 [Pseudorhodoplanes sinuspersici]
MHYSLQTAGVQTHIRIVVIALVAGIAVTMGAICARTDALHDQSDQRVMIAKRETTIHAGNSDPWIR